MGCIIVVGIIVLAMAIGDKYKIPVLLSGAAIWLLFALGTGCNESKRDAYHRGLYDGMTASRD